MEGPVLWIEKCPTCKRGMKVISTGDNGYHIPEGEMCDKADPTGCFKTYHKGECFDRHSCPVHPGPKARSWVIASAGLGAWLMWEGISLPGLFPGVWYCMAGGFLLGIAWGAATHPNR